MILPAIFSLPMFRIFLIFWMFCWSEFSQRR